MSTVSVKAPDDTVTGVAQNLGYASTLQQSVYGQDYSPKVKPTGRVYLMIKAQNFSIASTATTCPSFDICLRKCHLQNS